MTDELDPRWDRPDHRARGRFNGGAADFYVEGPLASDAPGPVPTIAINVRNVASGTWSDELTLNLDEAQRLAAELSAAVARAQRPRQG